MAREHGRRHRAGIVDCVDFLLSQAAGFVVGIITGIITGLWAARIGDRRKRIDQVQQVTATITRTWDPVPGSPNTKVMVGAYLDWIYWWYLATVDLTDQVIARQAASP